MGRIATYFGAVSVFCLFTLVVYLLTVSSPDDIVVSRKSTARTLLHEDEHSVIVAESQLIRSRCNVLHIGIVCTGYKSNLNLHTMLKSLYFYRNNPLHFHIMVDATSEKILKILFETWAVPQVTVTFYDVNEFISDVSWVPNEHYSGIYGLLKLMFPKAIPLNITSKLIVFDTDLTFNGDIYDLWNIFDDFQEDQALGLVDHHNNYYLGELFVKRPWPALGRGFNTGVILYHLENLQTKNWDDLWKNVTKETLPSFGKVILADQDIINTVISKIPSLLYNVSCEWNVQLNDDTDSYNCYDKYKIKIVHWNSPKKINVINRDGDYFRTLHTTFLEHDGNLLRQQLYNCSGILKANEPPHDMCYEYNRDQMLKRRTLLFLKEFKWSSKIKSDITLVSQLSYERLHIVEELSTQWHGPISVALYVSDTELMECLEFIENSRLLNRRSNIAYHAVFREGDYYPINYLRNVAMRNVATPYIFLIDLDLLPMDGLYWELKKNIEEIQDLNKTALVVAAFESRQSIPKTKEELLYMLKRHWVFPFHHKDFSGSYSSTNYGMWKVAVKPYQVWWKPYFEPYMVVSSDVVSYDDTFMEFGWDKISHTIELVAQGYKFLVLHNAFVVHKYHPQSNGLLQYIYSKRYRSCLRMRANTFIQRINRKYGTRFSTKKL